MKKWGYGLAGAALALVIGAVSTGLAATPEPGSDADPVVTKSYVEKVKQEILNVVKSQPGKPASDTQTPAAAKLIVEKVPAGKTIIGYAGTEFIVRTGKVVAHTPPGEGYGLPDLTAGTNITQGEPVPANHHLLLPRDDGRGLKVVKGPADIMIRGEYVVR
ncbi:MULTISPECIES: hypothetical protein [Aneurinibacillus]|uniref:Uncharacterized protein n=1 Tax=Aneurinibacillus thermoaerophilus TaxID=143495 RepID=A0A1G8DKD4_ANETH|nr:MULTISPECIES: hypothetical protein [Aneurinibacillus]MED0676170.1 hypothetical protein [Aneurinibacillus thermoaerophilus]MED0680667.1 hypothetical protein [Aneurinibacillus thermoaerophilus]MED0738668.1 hypothetical protein [Aneurinibacillus thermoaerophilus]MED0757785.1 hypothetical protein [Aneurinibacillus thermoaerophilus]MED0761531.1 hypothetical protein [Aneurinibacillus thermoaerophilus]